MPEELNPSKGVTVIEGPAITDRVTDLEVFPLPLVEFVKLTVSL